MVFLLGILPWLRANWRIILILVAAGLLYGAGRHNGASTVKARWTAALLAEQVQAANDKQELQNRANAQSASYQRDLARRQKTINALSKELKNEIHTHYAGCIAGDDIVSLWGKTFNAPADDSAAP